MIKNKRKQTKIIEKLLQLRNEYLKLAPLTYSEERNKYLSGIDSMVTFESETYETFYDQKNKTLENILTLYNNLNEKLPHHIRLELLE